MRSTASSSASARCSQLFRRREGVYLEPSGQGRSARTKRQLESEPWKTRSAPLQSILALCRDPLRNGRRCLPVERRKTRRPGNTRTLSSPDKFRSSAARTGPNLVTHRLSWVLPTAGTEVSFPTSSLTSFLPQRDNNSNLTDRLVSTYRR